MSWISLHRKLLDHDLWKERRRFSRAEAWIDVLLRADHEDGSLEFTLDALALRWSWTRVAVFRFLERLEIEGMIERRTLQKSSLLYVTNYERHQRAKRKPIDAVKQTTEQTTADTPETYDGNCNNERNKVENLSYLSLNTNKEDPPIYPPKGCEKAIFPRELTDSELFRTAWDDWTRYRKQTKRPLTPKAIELQSKKLAKFDAATAALMLWQSIENGWTGIFEVHDRKDRNNGKANPRNPDHVLSVAERKRRRDELASGSLPLALEPPSQT